MRQISGVVTIVCVLVFLTGTASANWIETISASGGSALDLGAAWGFGTVPQPPINQGMVLTGASSGALEISDTNAAAIGGAQGGSGLVISEAFQNVIVSATINPNAAGDMNNSVGVAARSDLSGNGYGLIYDFASSEFHLLRIDAGVLDYIDSEGALGLPAAADYFLKLSITGSSLIGELYDSEGGSLLETVTATDATYASGFSGVLVFADLGTAGSPTKGVWDNIVSIPEPTSLSLSLMGVAMLLIRARR